MRYRDEDRPEWGDPERTFATAWRAPHKWVVSSSLQSVGPDTTLVRRDIAKATGAVKAQHAGAFQVGGPGPARTLTDHGLIDLYRLHVHPVVLRQGDKFFAGPRQCRVWRARCWTRTGSVRPTFRRDPVQ